MNIYIGNLSYSITGDNLRNMLAEFGEIQEAKLITDHRTKQSKGLGFVEMPSNSEADQAIKALNGRRVDGRNIKVNPANYGRKKGWRGAFVKRRFATY